jgi:hypothetical protein
MYFAETTLPELAGVLTVIAGMLLGFYGVIKFILNQAIQDRHEDRKERLHLVDSLKQVAKSNQDVAKSNREIASATVRIGKEAEQRNGHIAELVEESKKQIIASVQEVREQHVVHQHVDKITKEKKR